MRELPVSWNEAGLFELANLVRGVTYTKSVARDSAMEGYLPVLRATNITNRGFNLNDLVYVPVEHVSDNQLIKSGDIVIATSSGSISVVGKAVQARSDLNAGFGAFCGLLRPSPKMEPRYFGYFFSTEEYRSSVSSMARGVNINNLKREHFESISMPVAPLNEQKRIADKLDGLLARVDACRETLDRVPLILKRFRQAVLSAATSGQLTEDWRRDKGELFEWKKTQIGHLLAEKPRNGYSPKSVEFETATRSLTLTATTSGRFNPLHFKYVDETIPKESHLWLKPGDILIQRANSIDYVGVSAIYDGPAGSFIYPDLMIKCRSNDQVLTLYLYYILSSQSVRNYFRENATGTAGNMPKINQQTVISAPAVVPPLAEQKEIVRRVEALLSFADRVEARFTAGRVKVESLTPTLLTIAFRGELVHQDPNDEPAEKLLERIRAMKIGELKIKKRSSAKKIVQRKMMTMKSKSASSLAELIAVLDSLEGEAKPEHLIAESGLSGNVDFFFELLREGRDQHILDVPVGSNAPIRRKANAPR